MMVSCIIVTVLLCTIYLLTCVDSVITSFQHRLFYENRDQEIVLSNGLPAPQSNTMEALYRWNTRTLISSFGMEATSRVEIMIKNTTILDYPSPDAPRVVPIVIMLFDLEQWRGISVLALRDILLHSPMVLCHYPSTLRHTIVINSTSRVSKDIKITFDITKSSLYTLQLHVCGDASVFVAGSATMINRGYDALLSEHLSVEQLALIPLYKGLIPIYTMFTILWSLLCYIRKKTVPRVSYVFSAALYFKIIETSLKNLYYRDLQKRGDHGPSFLRSLQDGSTRVTTAILVAVMFLSSLGWSLTREQLTLRERKSMGIIFSLYGLVALLHATCSPRDQMCTAYVLIEYLIKSVMMMGVLVALNATITELQFSLTQTRWNHYMTPLLYMKLQQFQQFRSVFFGYLLVPTCLLILSVAVITPPGSWRYQWVNHVLEEYTILSIFMFMAVLLRPHDPYTYTRLVRGTNPNPATASTTDDAPSSPPLTPPALSTVVPFENPIAVRAAVVSFENNRRQLQEQAHHTSASVPSPTIGMGEERPISDREEHSVT